MKKLNDKRLQKILYPIITNIQKIKAKNVYLRNIVESDYRESHKNV